MYLAAGLGSGYPAAWETLMSVAVLGKNKDSEAEVKFVSREDLPSSSSFAHLTPRSP